jgi:predicted TIM-barrel fold metal-dependent hydrolase
VAVRGLGEELEVPVTDTATVTMAETDALEQTLLIDTDVHEYLRSSDQLLPYLDPHWQRYITEFGWNVANVPSDMPYTIPHSHRPEWQLPDGTAGTEVEPASEHLFGGEKVTHAILCGLFQPSAQKGQYEFAAALASAYNDWQVENWLEKEPRMSGSVHVVAHDPEGAAREIDRVAAHPQIVQVFLPTVTDREYGDPHYRPIFEAALRNDLVVTFHHGFATRAPLGYPRYYLEWKTIAYPMAAASQIMSLICNGTFEKYPELKVVFLESGVAWVPWFMWRADAQYRESRMEIPWVKRLPSEHMRDNVRIATQPIGDIKAHDFAKLVEMTETERVYVFSTDYPHYDADSANIFKALPAELRQRIRYKNALETYPRLKHLAG